jgi:predicted nucleic acid-binding Zn ribbon protein
MYFMTAGRCAQCGGPLPPPAWTGRRRVYCSGRCRSLASYHRARARAEAEALTGEELIAWLGRHDPLAGLSALPDGPVSG